MDGKTAVIYSRVSSAKQAEENISVPAQVDRAKAKAEELGATVAYVFSDEGITGTDDCRQAFQDAITYCELHSPDYFITWSTSRFARNKIDAGLYKRRLDKAGTQIIYLSTPLDRATDSGWMLEGVLEIFDEYFSRQVSSDTRRSMIKNAQDGYWNGGATPFGFQPVPDSENPKRKRLEVNDDEADIVRQIFRLRLSGSGSVAIAAALNSRGLPHRGRPWNKSAVLDVLRSAAVAGQSVFNRTNRTTGKTRSRDQWIIVESHKGIVDREEWGQVQHLIDAASPDAAANEGSPKSQHIFTGLLSCGKCGASMQVETAKGRGKRYSYYNCRRAQRTKECPDRRIRADQLDPWLLGVILDEILNESTLQTIYREMELKCSEWEKNRSRRARDINRHIESINRKTNRIYELFETYGRDTPNLGDLTRRLRGHNNRIKDLEQELIRIDAETTPEIDPAMSQVGEMADLLKKVIRESPSPKKIRTFLTRFIRKIVVNGGHVDIEYSKDVLLSLAVSNVVPSKARWLPVPSLLGTISAAISLPSHLKRAA